MTMTWLVSLAIRTEDGRPGTQSFRIEAPSAVTAVWRAWLAARTPEAARRRRSAALMYRPACARPVSRSGRP